MEHWAELRREHFVRGVSIKELSRRTGLSRNTIRSALRSAEPPRYLRTASRSKLDPFKPEIARLLDKDPDLAGVRVGELIEPLGWEGGKTILDNYLREVRPLFQTARTTQPRPDHPPPALHPPAAGTHGDRRRARPARGPAAQPDAGPRGPGDDRAAGVHDAPRRGCGVATGRTVVGESQRCAEFGRRLGGVPAARCDSAASATDVPASGCGRGARGRWG